MRILEFSAASSAPHDLAATSTAGPSTATCLAIVVLVVVSILAAAAAPGLLQMWAAGHLRHEPRTPAATRPVVRLTPETRPDLVQQLVTVATALDLGDVSRARRDLAATLDVLLDEPAPQAPR